jgi:DNA-binding response OmpR family regulator
MSTPPVPVYIVEDNPGQRMLVHDVLETTDFRPRDLVSSEEMLAVYERLSPGIILLDLRLPGMGGASLVEELVRRGCWWPIIIVTARPDAGEVERVRKAGAINTLCKPLRGPAVIAALEDARKHLASARVENPQSCDPGAICDLQAAGADGARRFTDRIEVQADRGQMRHQRALRQNPYSSNPGQDRRGLARAPAAVAATAGMPAKPPA